MSRLGACYAACCGATRSRTCLCAAGLNTAITRTPLATTHILSILCGQSNVTVPCLAAALTALFLTHPFPFILSQRDREDVHLKVRAALNLYLRPPSPGLGRAAWRGQHRARANAEGA